jgi:hypothetical protein
LLIHGQWLRVSEFEGAGRISSKIVANEALNRRWLAGEKPLKSIALTDVNNPRDSPDTMLFNFTPFIAEGFGMYETNLTLSGQRYFRTFEVAADLRTT